MGGQDSERQLIWCRWILLNHHHWPVSFVQDDGHLCSENEVDEPLLDRPQWPRRRQKAQPQQVSPPLLLFQHNRLPTLSSNLGILSTKNQTTHIQAGRWNWGQRARRWAYTSLFGSSRRWNLLHSRTATGEFTSHIFIPTDRLSLAQGWAIMAIIYLLLSPILQVLWPVVWACARLGGAS